MRVVRAVAAVAVMCGVLVSPATASGQAFGEGFGIAPINDPGQAVPALPDEAQAFWAGSCDRAAAPQFGAPIHGGISARPASVKVPTGDESNKVYSFITVPAPGTAAHCLDWGVEADYPCAGSKVPPCPGTDLWAEAPAWRLPAVTQAGAHPDVTAMFHFARNQRTTASSVTSYVDGAVDDIVAELPAGLVGDPAAVTKCTAAQFAVHPLECPSSSQIGVADIRIEGAASVQGNLGSTESVMHPVYNLEPRHGNLAEFGIAYLSMERITTARVVAKARTHGDFGVDTFVAQIPAALPLVSQQITLWGVPWAAANDRWRAVPATKRIPRQDLPPAERVSYDSSWGEIRPFISNPTECSGQPLSTRLLVDAFERQSPFDAYGFPDTSAPGAWRGASADAPPVTGCAAPPFDPDLALAGATAADAPSGLSATVSLPANDDPPPAVAHDPGEPSDDATGAPGDLSAGAPGHWRSNAGLATAQLLSASVTMPVGWSVNPSGAAGLEACSDAQIGLVTAGSPPMFNNDDPFDGKGAECPLASRIGSAEIETPVLDEILHGDLVIGTPRSTNPLSTGMFRLFLVGRSVERGLVAKVAGYATADPATGQLTTTFAQNPRVPVEEIRLSIKGGQRGMLATNPQCAAGTWSALLAPWTSAHGAAGALRALGGALATTGRCAYGFAPSLAGGSSPRQAGGHGVVSLRFTRPDGDQVVKGLSVKLPRGLLAAVGSVPLCTGAQASANACPAASRIGTVDAAAGAGDPFVLERKGIAYLTEGYKGAPYGMAVSIPVEAGPFRGAQALDQVVVRQALHVDPNTAEVTAVSDPLPHIHHGIPLRAREVTVRIDRLNFAVNPTGCARKSIDATFTSIENVQATATTPFYADGCKALGFRPKLALRLTGRRHTRTNGHPGVRARVTLPTGHAGISRAEVRLPLSLALDPKNASKLPCEFVDGTKPDLENHCPRRSIVGRATAVSPLLSRPLSGNVYFVKNVRIDPVTGSPRRTLPMIVAALRGEISINLRGTSNVKRNQLVSTFATVPDAPVERFDLRIAGGRNGILVVTDSARGRINICRRKQRALSYFDAHNGKRKDTTVRVRTPCTKRKANRKPKARKRR